MRLALLILSLAAWPASAAEFRLLVGHGGPVMDAAVSEDGNYALTASFDNSVGYWALGSEEVQWLDAHRAAVKTAIFLDADRAASGGDDFAITLWDLAEGRESARLEGHKGQVAALSVTANFFSAGFDAVFDVPACHPGSGSAFSAVIA